MEYLSTVTGTSCAVKGTACGYLVMLHVAGINSLVAGITSSFYLLLPRSALSDMSGRIRIILFFSFYQVQYVVTFLLLCFEFVFFAGSNARKRYTA